MSLRLPSNRNLKGRVCWGATLARVAMWLILGLALSGCLVAADQQGNPAANPVAAFTEPVSLPGLDSSPVRVTPGEEVLEDQQPGNPLTPTPPLGEPKISDLADDPAAEVQTPTPGFDPAAWEDLPVLPELSPHARSIIRDGVALGNNPRAFSKIGDCESRTTWFLGDFDLGAQYYSLGPYEEELAPVVAYYQGSYNRLSLAAKPGFTAASLLSPIWADRDVCRKGEAPLACEYRLHRPIMAFILIGTNDASNPKTFEGHMRKVIELSLEQRVLPVLGTKADNVEGDHAINATIARLAYEYDVPLWNYWLAVQDLPGHGLQEDGAHLTFAAPHFNQPAVLKNAWPVRNLNALQILQRVMDETR